MKVKELIAFLEEEVENGNGDLQVVCDYPMTDINKPIEWSTVEDVKKRTVTSLHSGRSQDVIYLDWRA